MPTSLLMCAALRGRRRSTVRKASAAKDDRVPKKQSDPSRPEIPELGLVKSRSKNLTFGGRTIDFQADFGVIGDFPEPLHVAGIALIMRLLHAAARTRSISNRARSLIEEDIA